MFNFLLLTLLSCGPKVGPDPKAECSNEIGYQACDFTLQDQSDQTFHFYDEVHHGNYFIIDISAMWCIPCMVAASNVQKVADSNEDLLYTTILYETWDGRTPTPDDCALWAETFEIDEPVLAGSRDLMGDPPDKWVVPSIPMFYLVDQRYIIQDAFSSGDPAELDRRVEALITNED